MSSQWLKVEWLEQENKGMLDFNGKYETNIHRSILKSGRKEGREEGTKKGKKRARKKGRKKNGKGGRKEGRKRGKHKNTSPTPHNHHTEQYHCLRNLLIVEGVKYAANGYKERKETKYSYLLVQRPRERSKSTLPGVKWKISD